MEGATDSKKVWQIFKKVLDEKLEPSECEKIFETMSLDELALLRDYAVQARTTGIVIRADGGSPNWSQKPN